MDTGPDRPGFRRVLRRLSDGLIAYGIIGLVVASLGLAVLAWADGRVYAVAESVEIEVAQMTVTLDRTADTLHDAGSLAGSFGGTLGRTPASVRQAAQTVRGIRPNLEQIGAQLGSFELFGSAPLAGPARLFEEMATGLRNLDTELELIASDLESNRVALYANARSLTEAGDQTAILADRVRAGFIQDSLDDIRTVFGVLVVTLIALAALPAAGALILGMWLGRTFAPSDVRPRLRDATSLQRARLAAPLRTAGPRDDATWQGDAQRRNTR